jgi:hypothetical protein
MSELWDLVWGKPQIDPRALAGAVEREALREGLDFRTRLLIRDAADALEDYWGSQRWQAWLGRSRAAEHIASIRQQELGERGFPLLRDRLMDATQPETVRQYLRELGSRLHRPVRLAIGGSVALILGGHLSRGTEDIDVVDEVPAEIRAERALLAELERLYGLQLTHFQSHYLPAGWEQRVHTLEPFGKIQAGIVDALDVFLSKLFSQREKDRGDLRLLLPGLDRAALVHRLRESCGALLGEADLRRAAEQNWYVLTGEALPYNAPQEEQS